MFKRSKRVFLLLALAIIVGAPMAIAQQSSDPTLGPETGRPMPRYVSLKATKANVRRGPSQTNRIDWVLMRRGSPLRVTAEFGHWRRIHDEDGVGGWIHYSLLSGRRTVVIIGERVAIHSDPVETAKTVALAEKGVVGTLGACTPNWCEVESNGHAGWVRKSEIWGVGDTETRE